MDADALPAKQVVMRKTRMEPVTNRLGKYINTTRLRRRMAWRQKYSWISEVNWQYDYVIVSTSVPEKLHLAWCLLQQGLTVIPYFMDDWLSGNSLQWKSGNIQQVAKDILAAAPCWLMISRQLEKILRTRYELVKRPTLIIHNPAPDLPGGGVQMTDSSKERKSVNERKPEFLESHSSKLSTVNSHLIIYAGSIWPMHADALVAIARAVTILHHQGKTSFELCIYTGEAHWNKYKAQLDGPGVLHAGWKTYKEMQQLLEKAWLLLCAGSFMVQHKSFSDSSVQTKLTDYMAAGKPILYIGPSEGASGVFVEEHDAGFTIGSKLPEDIAAQLEAIARMPQQYHRKAVNGFHLAASIFSKSEVQAKLYRFLEEHVPAKI